MTRAVQTALAGSGGVLQVVQVVLGTTAIYSNTYNGIITGLAASITPKSTSSKILIRAIVNAATNNNTPHLYLTKNGTKISGASGELAGSRFQGTADITYMSSTTWATSPTVMEYLDSPATTSSTSYEVYLYQTGTFTTCINRPVGDADSPGYIRGISSITLMEIAG